MARTCRRQARAAFSENAQIGDPGENPSNMPSQKLEVAGVQKDNMLKGPHSSLSLSLSEDQDGLGPVKGRNADVSRRQVKEFLGA